MSCSCGEGRHHVVARRSTADGKHVLAWDDGALTWALGYFIQGAPRGGSAHARGVSRLVLGEVELWPSEDIPLLVSAARWTERRGGTPGDMRRKARELAAPAMPPPRWTVLRTDRDGRATTRVWVLPRLVEAWAGLVVWHESAGSHGRPYQLMRRLGRSDTLTRTGFAWSTLREAIQHLSSLREEVTP